MTRMNRLYKGLLFLIFFLVSAVIALPAEAVFLNQIRFGKQSDKCVRVVAHMDQKTNCRVFTLKNPNRVVIDFEDTVLDPSLTQNMPDPLLFVNTVRLGTPLNGQARLVLETAGPVDFKDGFFLTPVQEGDTWRYVVDITSDGTTAADNKTVLLPISPAPASTPAYKTKVQKPLVVLDPGHGGADPGAISYSGKYEKNLTLQMAKEVKKEIEKTGRYRVKLTRETDKALTLRGRIAFAHQNEADLFISIHADSAKNKKAKGLSVYTISERASDKEAQLLAERENKADIILGMDLSNEAPEVSNILIDLAKRDTMDKSSHYANILVKKMGRRVELVKNAHRFAGFVVLKSPNIPSVLIEIGYLSNREEERNLSKPAYRAKLATSIVEAIDDYFDTIYE